MRAPIKLALVMVVASATVLSPTAFTFDESKGAIDSDSVGVVAPVDEIMTKGGIIENATPAPTVSDNAIETTQPTDLTEKSFTGSSNDAQTLENKTLTKKGVDTAVTPSPTFSDGITFETSQETDVIPAPTDELNPDIDVTPAPTGELYTDTDVMSALKEGAKTPCPTRLQAAPAASEVSSTPTDEEIPVEEATLTVPNVEVPPAEEVAPAPLTPIEESTPAKTPCPPLSQPTQGPAVYIDEQTEFTNDTSFDTTVTPEPTISTSDETEVFGSMENTSVLNASSDEPITSSGATPCTVPPIAGSSSSVTPAPTATNDKDGSSNTATGIVPCPPLPQPKTPCPPLPQPKTPCPPLPQPKTPCPTLPQPKTPCPTLPQPETPRPSLVPPTEAVSGTTSSDEIVQRQQSSSDARMQASTAAGRIVSGLALVAVSTIYLVL